MRAEEATTSSSTVQTVIVDSEAPIQNGNRAEAKAIAQKKAFEKAVDQLLPATLVGPAREQKLKMAAQYVTGFQVVSEQEEGETLKLKYKCDVALAKEMPPAVAPDAAIASNSVAVPERLHFEIVWMPDQSQLSSLEVMKFISETFSVTAKSLRVSRGRMTGDLALRRSPEEVQSHLMTLVGRRGIVKVLPLVEKPVEASPLPPPVATQPVGPTPEQPTAPVLPGVSVQAQPSLAPSPSPGAIPSEPSLPPAATIPPVGEMPPSLAAPAPEATPLPAAPRPSPIVFPSPTP